MFKSYRSITTKSVFSVALICVVLTCFAAPSNRPKLVDDQGAMVAYACVVPLYRKVSGVAWGIEGEPTYSSTVYVMKPFRFSNGDDFLAHIVPWGRTVFPFGIASFGDGWELDGRLFLRKGYIPVTPPLFNKYVEKTLVMPRSEGREAEEALNDILSTPPDQNKLRALFGLKDLVQIDLTLADSQLLKTCME